MSTKYNKDLQDALAKPAPELRIPEEKKIEPVVEEPQEVIEEHKEVIPEKYTEIVPEKPKEVEKPKG